MASSYSKTTFSPLLVVAALSACQSGPHIPAPRHPATVAAFKRLHPCPSTDLPSGPCPGYIADHVIPLCAGGADAPENMQWQTHADALDKDRVEWATCRALRSFDK